MATTGGNSTDAANSLDSLDASRTYNQIISFQEARLARDALREKRALALTKRFLREREQDEQGKLEDLAEKSKQEYVSITERCKALEEAAGWQRRIKMEEMGTVFGSMQEKSQLREEEHLQAEAELQERHMWMQARKSYEAIQAQKRQEQHELALIEKKLEAKNREEQRTDAVKALQQEKEATKAERDKRRAEEADRAAAARIKVCSEQRKAILEQMKAEAAKQADAEKRRQERQESIAQANKEAGERRAQRIAEAKRRREQQREDASQKCLAKIRQAEAIAQEKEENAYRPQYQRGISVEISPQHSKREETRQRKADEVLKNFMEKEQANNFQPVTCWSPDVVNASASAGKEYVQRRADLEQASHHMLAAKAFKTLADVAKSTEPSDVGKGLLAGLKEEICTTRMRSLHNMFIAKTPREEPSSTSVMASQTSGLSSGESSARRMPPSQPCALCERTFPVQNLSGRFFRKVVDKYKREQAQTGSSGPSAETGGSMSAGSQERSGLYDHEVRLCGSCACLIRSRSL